MKKKTTKKIVVTSTKEKVTVWISRSHRDALKIEAIKSGETLEELLYRILERWINNDSVATKENLYDVARENVKNKKE
jgi:hypothetical protein